MRTRDYINPQPLTFRESYIRRINLYLRLIGEQPMTGDAIEKLIALSSWKDGDHKELVFATTTGLAFLGAFAATFALDHPAPLIPVALSIFVSVIAIIGLVGQVYNFTPNAAIRAAREIHNYRQTLRDQHAD